MIRTIKRIPAPNGGVQVVFNSAFMEYEVRFKAAPEARTSAYFTDDRLDAIGTAEEIAAQLTKTGTLTHKND